MVKRSIACLGRGGDATDPDSAPLPDRRGGAAGRGGARVVGDCAAAPGGEERAGAPAHGGRAEPAVVRALLPPGARLRALRVAAARPHRGPGGALRHPLPRCPRRAAGAHDRAGGPDAPAARGGGGRDPRFGHGAVDPGGRSRSRSPLVGARAARAGPQLRGRTHGAGERGACRVGGGRAAARPRGGGGNARHRRPARRGVQPRGHQAALHRGDPRGGRARQRPLLRDGAAREGAVGDSVRRAARGDRSGGRGRSGAARQPLARADARPAVGQLVSGVAHELNNPLTSIAGLAEFLLEQQELGPKDRDHLQVIHEQAERAGRIVRNLLTFARKGPGERARVNLNDVVQRTLLLMSYDLKLKDIRTEKNLGSGMPDVVGDRHALQQVVLNLVTNAAHALAGNEAGRPRTIRISTWFDERVRLRVADTGPGIPEEVLPHLFTPFFTTKEPGHWTGLGLSITYSIVEAHGGQITVQQPAEGGAAFLVELPPAGADVPQRHSAEVEAPPLPPAARRTILLVDDDPAVRRMIKALFGREGHTVEVARNLGQALDLARTRTYDLILADGQASARGRRFVEELVEARPDLPY